MALSDWRLAARDIVPGSPFVLVARNITPQRAWLYVIPVPGQLPQLVGASGVIPAGQHFPWGDEVQPD